jgi:hypothetical protein
MPFINNIQHMENLTLSSPNKGRYSNSYHPEKILLPDLVLLFPGRLNNGDYKLVFNGRALTHIDIVRAVHECTIRGNGKIITEFLVDLYKNGLNANDNHNISLMVNRTLLSLKEFKILIYWIVLQEDINYPRPRNMGVRMPITRYIEGAIAAIHPDILSLDIVLSRTNNHGRRPDPAFIHPDVSDYLTESIEKII